MNKLPVHVITAELRRKMRVAQAEVDLCKSTLDLLSPKTDPKYFPLPEIPAVEPDVKLLLGLATTYRNAYLYLKMRLQSVGYDSWAGDQEGEIEYALEDPPSNFCQGCEHKFKAKDRHCTMYAEKPVTFCVKFSRR